MHISFDGGKSWKKPALDSIKIFSLSSLPPELGGILAGTDRGIYSLKPASDNFIIKNIGLENFNIQTITALKLKDERHIFYSDSAHVFKYCLSEMLLCAATKNGILFKKLYLDSIWQNITPPDLQTDQDSIFAIIVHPDYANNLYIGTNRGVFRSVDGGLNWRKRSKSRLEDLGINAILVNPSHQNIIYAATNTNGVYRSRNFSYRWQPYNFGLGKCVNTMTFSPDRHTLYAGTSAGEIFRFELVDIVPQYVGIANFKTIGVPAEIGEFIANELIRKIDQSLKIFPITESEDGDLFVQETEFEKIKNNALNLNTDWIIFGEISSPMDDRFICNLSFYNVRTTETITDHITNCSLYNFNPKLIKEIVSKFRMVERDY